jgi:N-acetylmuramoyl-L-alanine amidase
VHVVYPSPNQLIGVRDSNFIFGSTGTGAATLTIDGIDVPVYPNGAFLAWIPVPAGERPHYELVARKGTDSSTVIVPISLRPPPTALPDTGRLIVDRTSVAPWGRNMLRGDEPVRVSIRAPANATVSVRTADGESHPLSRRNGVTWSTELPARDFPRAALIIVRRDRDSVTVATGGVEEADALPVRYVELLNANVDAHDDTDQVSIVRPTPGGTYKWLLFPGTIVEITGIRGDDWYRVRLDDQLEAWVEQKAVRLLPEGAPVPRRTASNARVVATTAYTDVRIPVTEKPAYQVQPGENSIVLTLYGTASNIDIVNFPTTDPTVRDITWEQTASDRVRVTVHLNHPAFGWLALWERGTFVLRVRAAPVVDAARPLAGRVIVIDPGHPPIGATGPTGLYEGDAVLDVALQLKPMLEAKGATVVMTRTARGAVALGDRAIISRRANADAFVSIHLNAQPDGVNPYRNNGTGSYFFFDQSEPLARAVERGLVREMGLRDLGINYDNLAVVRQTWMPAILCEGAFVILPEQEVALRDPAFQQRYAAGIAEGLEEYFRSMSVQP